MHQLVCRLLVRSGLWSDLLVTGNLSSCRERYQPLIAAEVCTGETPAARFDRYLTELAQPGCWADTFVLVRVMYDCMMCSLPLPPSCSEAHRIPAGVVKAGPQTVQHGLWLHLLSL